MSYLSRCSVLMPFLVLALGYFANSEPPGTKEKTDSGEENSVRTDLIGDPLPSGAIARLGTTRLRHVDYVVSLTFSPDGKTLVSAGHDRVRAWDVATGKELPPFGKEEKGAFCAALFPDGKTLATGHSAEIVLWDVARRQPASRLQEKNQEYSASLLAVSPDGETVAACDSSTIRLWQVKTGKLLRELEKLRWHVIDLAFSPNGQFLAASSRPGVDDDGDQENYVTLWELPQPKPRWQTKLPGGVNSVAFFPDGQTLAVGLFKGPVRYLAADTGQPVKGPEVSGRLVAVAPDGRTLAVVRADPKTWNLVRSERTVRLCDAVTGRERHRLEGHGSAVGCLAFSPDGKVLASGSMDGTIILWDTATGRELHPLAGHRYRVGAVAFSPDGRSLFTRGGDQTVRVWDLNSGKEKLRIDAGSQAQDWVGASDSDVNLAPSLACSPDGKWLATWDVRGRSIRVWDAQTGKQRFALTGHQFQLTGLASAPDGAVLASGDFGGAVRLWDVAEGKLLKVLMTPPPGDRRGVNCVLAFSEDGKRLAAYSLGGLQVWEVANGTRLFISPGLTNSLVFCRSGRIVATAGPDPKTEGPTIRLVEGSTGAVLRTLTWETRNRGSGRGRLSLAPSADGRYLAVADGRYHAALDQVDWNINVWELLTGQRVLSFNGHRGPVNGVAFSPDGTRLASASDDGTVLIWDLLALPKEREDLLRKGIDAAALDRLSSDLADAQSRQAFHAMAMLTRVPEKSVPFLRARLRLIAEGAHQDATRLIADLDADTFAVRDAASRALRARGVEVEPDLQRALARATSVEARQRIQELLDQCRAESPAPEVLWQERALAVLERLGTRDAKKVLQELSRGSPKALLTHQAQAALRRLERRPDDP